MKHKTWISLILLFICGAFAISYYTYPCLYRRDASKILKQLKGDMKVPDKTEKLEETTTEDLAFKNLVIIKKSILLDASRLLPEENDLPPVKAIEMMEELKVYRSIKNELREHYHEQIRNIIPLYRGTEPGHLGFPNQFRETVFVTKHPENVAVLRIYMANSREQAQHLVPPTEGESNHLFVRIDMEIIMRGCY